MRGAPSGFTRCIFLAALSVTMSATVFGQRDALTPLRVETLLVLESPRSRGRSPVLIDPVERLLVEGSWQAPEEGGEVLTPGGQTLAWRRISPGEDGWFRDRALAGGYASAQVRAPAEGVWLLEARGHHHLYAEGAPRVGDPYALGITRLPVHLHRGENELLVQGGRGRLRLTFHQPPAPVFIESGDMTLPDLVVGEGEELYAGVIVTNATTGWQRGLRLVVQAAPGAPRSTKLPALAPLSFRKMVVSLLPPPVTEAGARPVALELGLQDAEGSALHQTTASLVWRQPGEGHRRTFRSEIDGSVQYFAVNPAQPTGTEEDGLGLLLTLHGAGVEASGQAACYAPREWAHVVAPTNRRPFGFDWEDWGRLDALEVLARAEALLRPDPGRVYLTGHSMGGHGTWILGAQFPDRFAAIAPSAGWCDFWSYASRREGVGEEDPVERLLERAANGSRTLLWERNYASLGVYVLHGDQDDNVPVGQARLMRERLARFHSNWAYYERPGAGHWWGNACVDWPPLMSFLQQNQQPDPGEIRAVDFTTLHPSISSRSHWVTIEAQERWLELSRVEAQIDSDEGRLVARTRNVSRIGFDLGRFLASKQAPDVAGGPGLLADRPLDVVLDDQKLESVSWSAARPHLVFVRPPGEGWQKVESADPALKRPERCGPFKEAFRRHMLLVYGTAGTPEENAWALNKARYDAETFWYRGNGSVDMMADHDFDGEEPSDRNIILYGNADTNTAWSTVLSASPLEVRRRWLRVGDRRLEGGDLACLFVYPRAGSSEASVGVVCGTGLPGLNLTRQLPYFVSGVAYPDWMVMTTSMLEDGGTGVVGAGFFGTRWSLDGGEEAWRDDGGKGR